MIGHETFGGALSALLPDARLVEVTGRNVAATPEDAWQHVRHGDLGEVLVARVLFGLRTLPARLAGRAPGPPKLRIDQMVSRPDAPGFTILVDDPPHEVVVGAAGAVWRREIPFVHIADAHDFAAAVAPDRVRVAWALRVGGLPGGGSRVEVEVRVDPGSEDAWRRFRRYFAVVGPFSRLIRRSLLAKIARDLGDEGGRPGVRGAVAGLAGLGIMAAALATPHQRDRRATWGASAEIAGRQYPGDDLVPRPRWGWTHATVVDAPAAQVWPWIAQIGADRAGFYSYTWLENLLGCGIRDAARIHPEWQARAGDRLVLHPAAPALTVVEVSEGRHMVASGPADAAARAAGRPWAAASWLLATEPLDPGRTRIVSRYRCATSDDRRTRLSMGPAILEPISFAMDRRMLLGIVRRVERGRP